MNTTKKKVIPFLLSIIALLVCSLIYTACNNSKRTEDGGADTAAKRAALINPICRCLACLGYNGTRPKGMISFAMAQKMSLAYSKDFGKGFMWNGDIKTNEQDARSIWFDLQKMKQFIGYIEATACNSGCADSLQLGIRIYYAKYPDKKTLESDDQFAGVPSDYANHHTVFMVPTYRKSKDNGNTDFDPQGVKGCQPATFDPVKGLVFLGFDAGTGPDGQNHGSLRPPPDNTGLFPETGQ
jgi:hypothetical protein